MFKQLLEKLRRPCDSAGCDPARFNDPLALQTKWTPARGGGASFCTHRLVISPNGRAEFRATPFARLFALVFLLAGLGVGIGFSVSHDFRAGSVWDFIFPLLFGLAFAVAGGGMLYWSTTPIVFDLQRGYYWRGRQPPWQSPGQPAAAKHARLEEIHALQLVAEYCRGHKTSFYSYELNLVLRDGRRLNVVDHGCLARLRADAAALAALLRKPLWDAI